MVLFVIGVIIGTYSGFIYALISKRKMFCITCSDNSKREKFVNQRVVLKVRLGIHTILMCIWCRCVFEKLKTYSFLKRPHFSFSFLNSKQVVLWNKKCEKEHSIKKDKIDSRFLLQKSVDQDNLVHDSCAICWCPYRDGENACMSSNKLCKHVFHTDCIMPWFVERKRHDCPLCRRNFLRGFAWLTLWKLDAL